MKIQIDLKSAACGLIVGIAAVFAIGAGESSNQVGRYQAVAGLGVGGGFALIVDTATGKVYGRAQDWRNDANFWDAK